MGKLFPFEFAELGFLGLAYLTLFGASISIAVSAMGWRRRVAVQAAIFACSLSILRWFVIPAGDAWDTWFGPIFVAPLLVWIAVRAGAFRDRVPELLRTLTPLLCAAFTRDLYLVLLVVALLGFVDADGPIRKFMTRRLVGPIKGWLLFAIAFVIYCTVVEPHGVGFVGAIFHVLLAGFIHAMAAQGEQMGKYVIRRLRSAPIVMGIILVLSFAMMRTAPV